MSHTNVHRSNFRRYSYLKSQNAEYLDTLHQQYLSDPESVDETVRMFFEGIDLASEHTPESSPSSTTSANTISSTTQPQSSDSSLDAKAHELITAFRAYAHEYAQTAALRDPFPTKPKIDAVLQQISAEERTKISPLLQQKVPHLPSRLDACIEQLTQRYLGTMSLETAAIDNAVERDYILKRFEQGPPERSRELRVRWLQGLTKTEAFEKFLHTRYVAMKRFSIEGTDSFVPALDHLLDLASSEGVENIVLGMAHRGRLNVLRNIFQKPAALMLSEFEDQYEPNPENGDSDVKYHMGYTTDYQPASSAKTVHLSLACNPSHLEFVNPVVVGMARAKQFRPNISSPLHVLPILVHGDAALAGQGVVYETMGLSNVAGFTTAGTIHIVLNNQVGFTTDPRDSRSTRYCTDLAKFLGCPILHVNGDDVEACAWAFELAIDFRQKFKKDAFVNLIGYRRFGHNEGDEPAFTQPLLYKKIAKHPTPRFLYAQKLVQSGALTETEASAMMDAAIQELTEAQVIARRDKPAPLSLAFDGIWTGFRRGTAQDFQTPMETRISKSQIEAISTELNRVRDGFQMHPKLARFFEARKSAIDSGQGIDWGNAEMLAYATLLSEGFDVRLTGQDSERGTFTHRHAVVTDVETGEKYSPIQNLSPTFAHGRFFVYNSTLSETGVLGFEYGYSTVAPKTLVLWEGQFGDFANGAQVIIDQFIASAEMKWRKSCGLVLLLPHGYEGQGPEHSSARLERFLQLSAEENMIVANLTTPSQIFHALRRQMKWPFRKPLIIMSPKSLLRHPKAISSLEDLTEGKFNEVMDDPRIQANPKLSSKVKRLLFVSGKFYYDLVQELESRADSKLIDETAIIRIEQLYPWPKEQIQALIARYPNVTQIQWAQEETQNMGAWTFVDSRREDFGRTGITVVSRKRSASPAVGSNRKHKKEHESMMSTLFGAKTSSESK